MVNSKASKSKAQKTPTPLPATTSVASASTASAKKATKKPVATKTAAKRVPKVKDAAPAAVDPPASVVVECDTEQHAASDVRSPTIVVSEDFTAYLAKLQHAVSILSTLRTEFRNLERRTIREVRASEKLNNKRKRKAGTRFVDESADAMEEEDRKHINARHWHKPVDYTEIGAVMEEVWWYLTSLGTPLVITSE